MIVRPLIFGGKLKGFRELKDWTKKEIAQKIGVSEKRYEDLEDALHEPRAGDIVRLERRLKIVFQPEDFEQREAA